MLWRFDVVVMDDVLLVHPALLDETSGSSDHGFAQEYSASCLPRLGSGVSLSRRSYRGSSAVNKHIVDTSRINRSMRVRPQALKRSHHEHSFNDVLKAIHILSSGTDPQNETYLAVFDLSTF